MPETLPKAIALLLAFSGARRSPEAAPEAADPARMTAHHRELRCLVCRTRRSPTRTPAAVDLRRRSGDVALRQGDEEIVAYMTARYGDFVFTGRR
jgi:cytochrome c-type biogenesis protein CcmH/NrfF